MLASTAALTWLINDGLGVARNTFSPFTRTAVGTTEVCFWTLSNFDWLIGMRSMFSISL
jgi:hypothetical protein